MFFGHNYQMKNIAKVALCFGAGICLSYGALYFLNRKSDQSEDVEAEESEEEEAEVADGEENYGVFIVRKDLKMGKGKIAAQCGHASLGVFLKVSDKYPSIAKKWLNEDSGFKKKFYYCKDESEMDQKNKLAKTNGFETVKIHDAGRTQIAPNSATVLAIGPVKESQIEELASGLTPIL